MSAQALKSRLATVIYPPPKGARVTMATTKAKLAIELFAAGFRDISKAKLLLSTLDMLAQDTHVDCVETKDRFQLVFSYLNTLGGTYNGKVSLAPSVGDNLANLATRLRMLASAYTLEHIPAGEGQMGHIALTLVKNPILVSVDVSKLASTRQPMSWAPILDVIKQHNELQELPSFRADGNKAGDVSGLSALELDVALVYRVLASTGHGTYTHMPGYWAFHEAALRMPQKAFASNFLNHLIQQYPKALHERYRFMVTHQLDGMTRVDILRRAGV